MCSFRWGAAQGTQRSTPFVHLDSADAFINSSARGSSVFALSEKGATSTAARYLAKTQNEADLIGGVKFNVRTNTWRTLFDLTQTATIADSLKIGKQMLRQLGEINRLHRNEVEQAVCRAQAPDIPSVLVETAFISNPAEEAKLTNSSHQDKIADALFDGIRQYFAKTRHWRGCKQAAAALSQSRQRGLPAASQSRNMASASRPRLTASDQKAGQQRGKRHLWMQRQIALRRSSRRSASKMALAHLHPDRLRRARQFRRAQPGKLKRLGHQPVNAAAPAPPTDDQAPGRASRSSHSRAASCALSAPTAGAKPYCPPRRQGAGQLR